MAHNEVEDVAPYSAAKAMENLSVRTDHKGWFALPMKWAEALKILAHLLQNDMVGYYLYNIVLLAHLIYQGLWNSIWHSLKPFVRA